MFKRRAYLGSGLWIKQYQSGVFRMERDLVHIYLNSRDELQRHITMAELDIPGVVPQSVFVLVQDLNALIMTEDQYHAAFNFMANPDSGVKL